MRRVLIGCALLAWSTRASASEWHVLPTGSASGDGSSASPWDIATAASGAAGKVLPGDTVWVHAGTYGNGGNQPVDFTLSGTSAAPVVVRAARGERATIDGGVIVNGQWVTLWGLEITNSSTLRDVTANVGDPNARLGGVNLYGRGDRAINLVVHNTGHPAIGFWNAPGDGAEVYGCIIWGNGIYDPSSGFNGSPRGNGTYAQNTDGDRHITDNVSFRNWTEGLDAHSAGIGFVNGFHFEGNIVFDNPNGQITANTKNPANPMQRMHVVDNCTYRRSGDTGKTSVQLGYYNEVTNEDVTIAGNYLVMGSDDDRAFHVKLWKRGTVTGNTIVSERYFGWWWNGVPGEALTWDQNRYFGGNSAPFILGAGSDVTNGINFLDFAAWKAQTGFDGQSTFSSSKPSGLHVCKRRNRYEPERAFVAVYNWDALASVDLDVSDLLGAGHEWQLIDVQNYFAGPIASGTFSGPTISVPMNLSAIAPILGSYTHWTNAHTAPEFAVFELRSNQPLGTPDGGAGAGGSGASGSGGSAGTGNAGSSGQSAGGASGSGANQGSGGSSASGSGAGGSNAATQRGSGDDGGCGCRTHERHAPRRASVAFFGLLLLGLRRRRARRARSSLS